MEQELAYSFHLGSDKNKSKLAKKVAKENVSGTTSLANNSIQTAKDLSDANKHNLRDYDNQRELIRTIYGTNDIVNDVKQVYLDEFEQARLEYNEKQTREDRKIKDYFNKISQDSQRDLACEIIIELGDMDFWKDKDMKYKKKMSDVYNEKVKYLINMINDMDIKDKLRLAICMSQIKWSGLIYNTKENYEKFDTMLKEVDEEYRTTLINFAKYKLVMFAMAKIMEMDKTEQNKVSLYLFNIIR